MSKKKKLSAKGLAKKDYRQFVRRLRKYFKDMPKGYNPYQRPIERSRFRKNQKEKSTLMKKDIKLKTKIICESNLNLLSDQFQAQRNS